MENKTNKGATVIPLFPLIQQGLVSVTRESKCMKYWLTT